MDIDMATQLCKIFCECRLPQAIGAIDRTHVEISTLENETSINDYCLKYKYAINIHTVIGLNLIFMNVDNGFHGSVHDSRILHSISHYTEVEQELILSKAVDVTGNNEYSLCFLETVHILHQLGN